MSLSLSNLPPEVVVHWSYNPDAWEEGGICGIYGCMENRPEYDISLGDGSEESDKLLDSLGLWGYRFLVCETHKDWLVENCNEA